MDNSAKLHMKCLWILAALAMFMAASPWHEEFISNLMRVYGLESCDIWEAWHGWCDLNRLPTLGSFISHILGLAASASAWFVLSRIKGRAKSGILMAIIIPPAIVLPSFGAIGPVLALLLGTASGGMAFLSRPGMPLARMAALVAAGIILLLLLAMLGYVVTDDVWDDVQGAWSHTKSIPVSMNLVPVLTGIIVLITSYVIIQRCKAT